MLRSLELRNFKSAHRLELPFRELTVLSGPNGSGKSTVLQAIGLIYQSLRLPLAAPERMLQLLGPLVQLGTASDVLSEHASTNALEIIAQVTVGGETHELHWAADITSNGEQGDGNRPDSDVLRIDSGRQNGSGVAEEYFRTCHFQFLQADRLTPRTHYERSDAINRELGFLGSRGEFTPDYLAQHGDRLEVSPRRQCSRAIDGVPAGLVERIVATPKLYDQVSGWLQNISPGVRLEAARLSQTDLVALRFAYASTGIAQDSGWRRPANVGFGLTYSLPIVTACLAAPRGALLLLENPEAHLHPCGQAALGTLLAKCAADGVRLVVETHSDHILNGIRLAVKNGEIRSDQVQICNFTREPVNGNSYIETPRILPNGELTAWPDGFFDQWEKSLEALLR